MKNQKPLEFPLKPQKGKTLADARQAAYAELADYLLDDLSPHYRRDIAAEFY